MRANRSVGTTMGVSGGAFSNCSTYAFRLKEKPPFEHPAPRLRRACRYPQNKKQGDD